MASWQRERQEDVGGASRVEGRGHHADDRLRHSLDLNRATDHAMVPIESFRPKTVTDHRHLRRFRRIVRRGKGTSNFGGQSEELEVAGRDPGARNDLRNFAQLDGNADARTGSGDILKDAARTQREEFRNERRSGARVSHDRHHHHDSLGVRERERPQHDSVERAEHGGRRANAERERGDCDHRESRCAGELPPCEREILAQLVTILGAARAPVALLAESLALLARRACVAKPSLGLGARLLSRHAGLHQLARGHLEMERELRFHLVAHAAAPEGPFHSGSSNGVIAVTKLASSFVWARSSRRPAVVMA